MVFRIEPHKGRSWQVFRDGVPVFSGFCALRYTVGAVSPSLNFTTGGICV